MSPQCRWPIHCNEDGSNKFRALLDAYKVLSPTVGASVANLIVLGGGVAIKVAKLKLTKKLKKGGRTVYTGQNRTGAVRWQCATAVDILFGSHPIL